MQARALYTPPLGGHSRSIPQGMILDVQPLVKSLFCPIKRSGLCVCTRAVCLYVCFLGAAQPVYLATLFCELPPAPLAFPPAHGAVAATCLRGEGNGLLLSCRGLRAGGYIASRYHTVGGSRELRSCGSLPPPVISSGASPHCREQCAAELLCHRHRAPTGFPTSKPSNVTTPPTPSPSTPRTKTPYHCHWHKGTHMYAIPGVHTPSDHPQHTRKASSVKKLYCLRQCTSKRG